jgi:hypothetical protein
MDKKIKTSLLGKIFHHGLTIILISVGTIFISRSFSEPPYPTPATLSPTGLMAIGLTIVLLSIPTYIWLENKLRFERIQVNLDQVMIIKILKRTAKLNDWYLDKDFSTDNRRLEFTKINTPGTSNKIVIELNDKEIFINARGNYPTDKKIIKSIRTALTVEQQRTKV